MSEKPRADSMVYGLALVVALIAGAAAVLSATGEDEAPAASAEGTAAAEPEPAAPDAAEEPTGGVEIVEPAPRRSKAGPDYEPDLPEVPDLEREPPPEREPAAADPRFADLGAEMRILSRARELLAEHPAEALSVLEQHRRRHPGGALREEREAFAIEALVNLEHVHEAERRYYDFLRDFPHSDFDARLAELMQRPPHEVGAMGR